MSKLDNDFKNEFNNLEFDSDRIQKQIMIKYNNHKKTKKITVSIISLLMLTLVGFGIVYAQEIGEVVKSLFAVKTNYTDGNGIEHEVFDLKSKDYIEFNDNLELDEPNCKTKSIWKSVSKDTEGCEFYSDTDIEKMLGVKLIKSNLDLKKDYLLKSVRKTEEDKISLVSFKKLDFYNDYENEKEDVPYVSFWITARSSEWGNDTLTRIKEEQYEEVKKIKIDNINVEGYLLSGRRSRRIYIVYDKLTYTIDIVSNARIISDLDKEVENLINSLYV